jgi:hypothetical protein
MNDDSKTLTKKDLIEALAEWRPGFEASMTRLEQTVKEGITGLERSVDARITGLERSVEARIIGLDEGLREYVHDTETRILKAFHVFSATNELRLGQLEEFGAAAGKRLAILEAAGRFAELELRVAEIEKKLDRRQ